MRESKMRNVDFSLEELAKRAGLTRKQFTDRLNRVCELYNLDRSCFKVYPDEEDSIYFLPPDIAEFLLLLVKNVDKHPMYIRTAKKEDVHATRVAEFNRAILQDIDQTVSMPVKEIMYERMGHLVSERIAYWGEPMVKHLTRFLVNLATMSTEDVGAALSMFTKKIDEMNYYVFRSDYLKRYVTKENIKVSETEPLTEEQQEKNHLLNDSNVSIDIIISTLLKEFITQALYIRAHNFQTPKESICEDYVRYKMIGLLNNKSKKALEELKKIGENPVVQDEREIYYEYFIRDDNCAAKYSYNEYMVEHQREQQAKWRPINEKILEGDYFEPIEVTVEKKKEDIKTTIKRYEDEISNLKERLQELEEREDDETNALLKEVQNAYVKHCSKVDEKYKDLYEITDKFVGQALGEFLS